MPQAAQQGQQKSLDEALMESIASHEEGQQEPPQEQPEAEALNEAEAQPQEPGGEEEGQQAAPEGQEEGEPEKQEAPKQAKPTKAPAKEGKEAKPPSKPPPALSSWPPHLREEFHKLPRPVKDQILKQHGEYVRRESEFSRQMQVAKQQIETAKPLSEALAPFMPHLQAVGVAPGAAVRNLFQTEYVLRTGQEAQKAAIVANLMGTYGVTPAALVAVLEGKPAADGQETQPPPQQRRQQEPIRDPEFAAFKANLLRQAQAQKAAGEERDAAALREFVDSGRAEFFDDVAADMVDLAQSKRNKGLSWEELYEKACLLNDDVRTVLEKRKAAEAVALRSQKAQQARRAASSVRTDPGAPQGARKLSLEEQMRRDIEAVYGPQAV